RVSMLRGVRRHGHRAPTRSALAAGRGGAAMTGRLIISGTREELSAEDRAMVLDIIAEHVEQASDIAVGDCPTGIDALVRETRPRALRVRADWQTHGRRAGPERNGRMVAWAAEVPGSVLLAFPGPTSRGTWD